MSDRRDPPYSPDWATVQEIHTVHNQGGKLDQADITVNGKGEITIRRQYLMPGNQTRVIKNTYSSTDELDCKADLFMLQANQ